MSTIQFNLHCLSDYICSGIPAFFFLYPEMPLWSLWHGFMLYQCSYHSPVCKQATCKQYTYNYRYDRSCLHIVLLHSVLLNKYLLPQVPFCQPAVFPQHHHHHVLFIYKKAASKTVFFIYLLKVYLLLNLFGIVIYKLSCYANPLAILIINVNSSEESISTLHRRFI